MRLEKEGCIKEYTVMPDFTKLGYEIMALTFLGYKAVDKETLAEATEIS